MVGYHGHDQTNDPNQTATLESYDTLMAYGKYNGINLDIGHFTSANYDAVAFIKQHHDKITNLHLKDRTKNHGQNTPWGQGDTPIKDVLLLLKKGEVRFPGEYRTGVHDPAGFHGGRRDEEVPRIIARTYWRRMADWAPAAPGQAGSLSHLENSIANQTCFRRPCSRACHSVIGPTTGSNAPCAGSAGSGTRSGRRRWRRRICQCFSAARAGDPAAIERGKALYGVNCTLLPRLRRARRRRRTQPAARPVGAQRSARRADHARRPERPPGCRHAEVRPEHRADCGYRRVHPQLPRGGLRRFARKANQHLGGRRQSGRSVLQEPSAPPAIPSPAICKALAAKFDRPATRCSRLG